jgi:hypothetical protein
MTIIDKTSSEHPPIQFILHNHFTMPTYDTLVQALEGLRKEGFTLDFNIAFDKLECLQNGICLNPEQFLIVSHHRFEGESDPADESVVYGITSEDGQVKGVLVSAFGIYADTASEDMIRKLKTSDKHA